MRPPEGPGTRLYYLGGRGNEGDENVSVFLRDEQPFCPWSRHQASSNLSLPRPPFSSQ